MFFGKSCFCLFKAPFWKDEKNNPKALEPTKWGPIEEDIAFGNHHIQNIRTGSPLFVKGVGWECRGSERGKIFFWVFVKLNVPAFGGVLVASFPTELVSEPPPFFGRNDFSIISNHPWSQQSPLEWGLVVNAVQFSFPAPKVEAKTLSFKAKTTNLRPSSRSTRFLKLRVKLSVS